MSDTQNNKLHHADQNPPYEWRAVEHNGQTFVAWDQPEGIAQLFVVTGQTKNVRALVSTNHVLYDGNIVQTHYDDKLHRVAFSHEFAGNVARHQITDWLDKPVIQLKKIRSEGENFIK